MNKVILAPAGGRKTQTIIERCLSGDESKRRLIITYTTTGQKVIQERIMGNKNVKGQIEILGWFSFLLNHIIYPYSYDKYPNQEVNGFRFVEGKDPTMYRKGATRYFDDEGKVYSNRIGKLAYDIAISSNDSWIDRLERIYDEIYFDEVQDLGGNDLDILKLLFQSKVNILALGDIRQTVYTTSSSDTKHKNYKGLNKISWFRKMQTMDLCEVKEENKTWRCNQEIIDFADSVLPKRLEFPKTESENNIITHHDGVFLVSWDNLNAYIKEFNPQCYRHSIKSKISKDTTAINFGLCKGETVQRVLIYPTGPIKEYLKDNNKELKDTSASSFYVAITRAMYSVAIVVEKTEQYPIKEWMPEK